MKTVLLILDGAGLAPSRHGNAITAETMPYLFRLMKDYGYAVLDASGPAVGLDDGMVGNSEVGHLTIGAGRPILSVLSRIDAAFSTGEWASHALWPVLAEYERLHLVGLLSDAGVHGHCRSIVQAATLAVRCGVRNIVVHPILDGVDSAAGTAPALLAELTGALRHLPGVTLGVIVGRRSFCDRSGNLDLTRSLVDALTSESRLPEFTIAALKAHYPKAEADFPAHLYPGGRVVAAGEPVLLTSHRADRAVQAARALAEKQPVFALIELGDVVGGDRAFFPSRPLDDGLAFEFKTHGISSVRIAEQCKFPHVTYFFNGFNRHVEGREICVPSLPDKALGERPEMSISDVAWEILRAMTDDDAQVVIANIANLDQIGHLGDYDLAVKAAKYVDEVIALIHSVTRDRGWTLLITSDHGNADLMIDADGRAIGSHSDRPVPFVVIPGSPGKIGWLEKTGSLANIAASLLTTIGVRPPAWMAASLLKPLAEERPIEPSTQIRQANQGADQRMLASK
jgi:2,3-bisphosphoglycerate-independent phosphoglycerate mutase